MDFTIRKFEISDEPEIITMMEEFYSSDAVCTNGSFDIFKTDFQNCIGDNPYVEGYVFCLNSEILGYSMVTKGYSTEFGKLCIWLEDLYLKPEYRGKGIIPKFITYIKQKYIGCVFKLEVENENAHAMHVYTKMGFEKLPYVEMINLE